MGIREGLSKDEIFFKSFQGEDFFFSQEHLGLGGGWAQGGGGTPLVKTQNVRRQSVRWADRSREAGSK